MKELQARHDYPVAVLCSALGVSRSGYYAWCERPASARQRDDERLKVAIRGVHAASRQTYGTRRVLVELRAQGFEAGRDRVDRLRRTMALRCRQKRCFRVTTDSEHTLPVADNLLQQDFTASAPDQLWLTDITYIRTDEGWLYLAGIKDMCTREIVGYAMDERMTQQLCLRALGHAHARRRPPPGLIHHSDAGSQYTSVHLTEHLALEQIRPSIGSVADSLLTGYSARGPRRRHAGARRVRRVCDARVQHVSHDGQGSPAARAA